MIRQSVKKWTAHLNERGCRSIRHEVGLKTVRTWINDIEVRKSLVREVVNIAHGLMDERCRSRSYVSL